MQNLSRYLLVGLLMTGMTVNTAAANRWFHGMACQPACQPTCIEICPPVLCCPPVDCCQESVVISETQTACLALSSEDENTDAPLPVDANAPETPDPGPAPSEETAAPTEDAADLPEQEDDPPESSIVNKPTSEPEETELSPPPVAVPQPTLDNVETPADSEPISEPETDSLFDAPATPDSEPLPENLSNDVPAADDTAADDPAAVDDLFDEPTTTDGPLTEVDLQDDLFSPTTDKTDAPADTAPEGSGSKENSEEEVPPTLDELFGKQPVLGEPGGLASRTVRWWTDDGARFRCEARLQQVTAQAVVLVKNDGKRVAVPFSRLCDDDLQFVHQQVLAQQELLAQRAAAEQLASLWSK